jgi:hypothetical protein
MVSSDHCSHEAIFVCVCLRLPAIGFAFRRGGRVGLWLIVFFFKLLSAT